MIILVTECIFIFILTLLIIKFLRDHALHFGLVDTPNYRSSHTHDTPRGAGIGLFLSVALISPFFHTEFFFDYLFTYLAIFMVFVVGILDDYQDVSPYKKMLVIVIAVFFLAIDDIIVYDLGTFFDISIHLGWFAIPFTVFAVAGFTNALNLIDGLDGLAASVSIVILSSLCYIGYIHDDSFIFITSLTFTVALLAFLVFNWHPASIFMGDSGSLTLGFVIAILSVKSLIYIPAVAVLFIVAIPIFDTIIVMIRRKRNGKSMFTADTCHMHHLILGFFGGDVQKSVISIGLLQIIYALTGLQISKSTDGGVMLLLFTLNAIFLYMIFNRMVIRQKKDC